MLHGGKGEGILYREVAKRLFLLIRQGEAVLLPCGGTKHTVYKCSLARVLCQLNRLVNGGIVGHGAHVYKLAEAEAKNILGMKLNLVSRPFGKRQNIVVVGQLALHGSVKKRS